MAKIESQSQIHSHKDSPGVVKPMASEQGMSQKFKYFLTLWAFFENLLFSGLRAGWPALVYILKQEHIYSYLCVKKPLETTPNATVHLIQSRQISPSELTKTEIYNASTPYQHKQFSQHGVEEALVLFQNLSGTALNHTSQCDEQDAVFNQCFTITTATMALSALLYGQLNYKFGIRAPRVLSVFLFVAGSMCIAFINKDVPWLVFPGFILISSGGMALYLTNNQISYLYSKGSAGIVGLLCGALEASSFVQTVIKIAYESGVSLLVSHLVLGALYLCTLLSTFFFLPRNFIPSQEDVPKNNRDDEEHIESTGDPDLNEKRVTPDAGDSQKKEHVLEKYQSEHVVHNYVTEDEGDRPIGDFHQIQTNGGNDVLKEVGNSSTLSGASKEFKGRSTKKLLECLFSRTYLLYLFWACVVQIILAMCLGTFNPWLEFVTNKNLEEVSRFTDVLLYSMLGSPVLSLCIGLSMDFLNKGDNTDKQQAVKRTLITSSVSLGATSVLGVIACAFFIVSGPDIIVVTSIALVIFRTALYSCGAAFLRIMYPTELFGLLCGIMSLMSGGISFVQYPLFLWVQTRVQAWKEVFGFLGLLGIVSLVQPIYLLWKSRQIERNN
ncbi:solute carrier family 43 member 3 [Biomphalaria glabrata]|nr:solute carrier family 43 member 3 [Biomphalaria glabrata]